MSGSTIGHLVAASDPQVALTDTVVPIELGDASATLKATIAQIQAAVRNRTGQVYNFQGPAKVGTTAGWVVGAANNLGKMATLPAAQTNSTLVVPIGPLKEGSTITAFALNGSLQSGGNASVITADLRVLSSAAGGAIDNSIGAMAAPLSVTVNTTVMPSNAGKTGLSHLVVANESYYVLITSTTGAACTQELQSILVTITEA